MALWHSSQVQLSLIIKRRAGFPNVYALLYATFVFNAAVHLLCKLVRHLNRFKRSICVCVCAFLTGKMKCRNA